MKLETITGSVCVMSVSAAGVDTRAGNEPSRRLSFTIVEGSYEPLRGLKFHNHE